MGSGAVQAWARGSAAGERGGRHCLARLCRRFGRGRLGGLDGGGRRAAVRVQGVDGGRAEAPDHLREKELLASTWGLVAFAPWLQQGVVSWTDNTVAMAAMRSMAPRTEVMQAIVARRTEYLFEVEILEESRRIT